MSKKGAKNTKEVRQYDIGDVVLGKVRGYPPWPGMVVDPADVPHHVLSEQPPGKKVTLYCVIFFPMGDYAWLHSKDMSTLKKHEMEAFLADDNKKRNRDLCEGYRIAVDPKPFLQKLKEDRAAIAQELEEREQNAEVDQLESEPEDDQDDDSRAGKKSKAASKKRKRESDVEPKPKKTPKSKKDSAEPTKKKSVSAKGKKNGVKSKAMVESEDEGDNAEEEADDEGAGPSKKASPPPTKKAKREKDEGDDSKLSTDPQADQVRDWRHRLQKTFLSNKAPPKPELMPEIDVLFTTVEEYESMTIEQLQHSKIGKVMRHIAALDDGKIPRDDEFKFRTRAKDLVDKWHQILNANKPPNGSPTTSTAGQTNGKSDKEQTKLKDEDEVTQGTKNLDLNGKSSYSRTCFSPVSLGDDADEDANADIGDVSMLADVTMSEA
ncbi:Tudor/PWWP/MBT [Phlegmacium glaucopus]|nr:Tudor/PWWP/MBT [Phlegmacium glaucopus]